MSVCHAYTQSSHTDVRNYIATKLRILFLYSKWIGDHPMTMDYFFVNNYYENSFTTVDICCLQHVTGPHTLPNRFTKIIYHVFF